MISTIIFDFGDVFINLDKAGALNHALELFGISDFDESITDINATYEKGLISTDSFIDFYMDKFPFIPRQELCRAWNNIIRDFPEYRLDFLRKLRAGKKYQLMLLSNTNHMHIDYVKATVPFYKEFQTLFDQFYLSHLINLRKPDREIFEMVLYTNRLKPEACLFIDDTPENTRTAALLGMKTWTIDPEKEDIIDLFKKTDIWS
ncbi:MAG: HAD family phosphatase [Flavobacteriaceae bacterium]|nr:HAD family phosphatase [Flavobacteriaceae bacterium]